MGDFQHNLPGPRAAALPERCQFCETLVAGLIPTASTVSANAGTSPPWTLHLVGDLLRPYRWGLNSMGPGRRWVCSDEDMVAGLLQQLSWRYLVK